MVRVGKIAESFFSEKRWLKKGIEEMRVFDLLGIE